MGESILSSPPRPVAVGSPNLRTGPRFYAGVAFFILFLTSPLFIPLVVLLPIPVGAQAALSAGLAIGLPEVFGLISIWLLGRETFDYLLRPVKRFIDRVSPKFVSRRRHAVGLAMLLLPIADAALFMHWDDWRDLFAGHMLVHAIVWNVMIFSGFLMLGGSFRTKLRALFVHSRREISDVPMADECQ